MPPLFVRLPNHLGDACMCLPALDLLARSGHALVLIGKRWAPELFGAYLSGDYEWSVLTPRGSWTERVGALRAARSAWRGDRAVLFTNSFSSALEGWLAGFACTGYATDARRWLLARAVDVPKAWALEMHTVEYYFDLARAFTGSPPRVPSRVALKLAPAAEARARELLAGAGVDGPYAMLCPAVVGVHHGRPKAWSGFPRLCTGLQAHSVRVLAVPGPGERAAVTASLPGATILPETDVGSFAALLRGAQLVVANDSGPGHLAAAVGASLVSVFGVTNPVRTRPWTLDADLVGGAEGWPDFDAVWERVQDRLALAPPDRPRGTTCAAQPSG